MDCVSESVTSTRVREKKRVHFSKVVAGEGLVADLSEAETYRLCVFVLATM